MVEPKTNQPIQASEPAPPDAKVFNFEFKAQAREWYHRREWERLYYGNLQEQMRLSMEEKEWIQFHTDMRERIDAKKAELERLLHSDIIKNVTSGLDIHGFKISEEKEIFRQGSTEPFCGLGGVLGEGIDRATLMIAIFELYLEAAHSQESKKE